MGLAEKVTAGFAQAAAAIKERTTPLALGIVPATSGNDYPDNRSYFKYVSASVGWPANGILTGQKVDGQYHVQMLRHIASDVTYTRFASVSGTWSAWSQVAPLPSTSGGGGPQIDRDVFQEPVSWITQFQSGHGFTVYGNDSTGTNLNNTTNPLFGNQMATVRTQGGGQFVSLNGSISTTDMTGRTFAVRVKVANPTAIQSIGFSASNNGTAFTNRWDWYFIGGSQNWGSGDLTFFLPWRDANVVGTPDRTAINAVQITMVDKAGGSTSGKVTVDATGIGWIEEARQEDPNGVVTIGLDDCHSSQATLAWPLLAARGMVATLFPITGIIGQTGRLTEAQIEAMVESGCEVGLHAATQATHNAGWTGLSQADRITDMTANRDYITSRGWPGAEQSAYPNGTFDDATIGDLRKFAMSARTTLGWPAGERMTPRAPMPLLLKAVANVGGSGGPSVSTIIDGLDRVRDDGGWMSLVLHDFVASSPVLNQITVSDFTTLLDAIQARGIAVRTQGQVIRNAMPTGVGVTLKEPRAFANPQTPGSGVTAYAKRRGRVLPAIIGPRGHDVTLQPHLGLNRVVRVSPTYGTTTVTSDGIAMSITSGGGTTVTARTPSSAAGLLGSTSRFGLVTTTTAGTAGTIRGGTSTHFLSTTAGMGGFDFKCRFGFASVTTGTRAFVGFSPNAAGNILASANPEAAVTMVGCGWGSSDTPSSGLFMYTNDSSGTATKITTGIQVIAGEIYELHMYAPPGGYLVDWCIRRVSAPSSIMQGTITTDLPGNNTMLAPHVGIGNGALAAAHSIDVLSLTIETDN